MPRWDYLMLHHSATKDSGTVSWSAIRRYHTDPNGLYKMKQIGYHWGVELIGDCYEILVGRTMSEEGAHCREAEMNRRAIGICLVGDFDAAPPPEEQLVVAARLVTWLVEEFKIPTDRVIGHRDAGWMVGKDWRKGEYKSCPGVMFPLVEFRRQLPPFPRSAGGGRTG